MFCDASLCNTYKCSFLGWYYRIYNRGLFASLCPENFKSAVGVKTSGDLILVAECKESNHIFPDVRPCALKSQRTQLIHSLSLHCKIWRVFRPLPQGDRAAKIEHARYISSRLDQTSSVFESRTYYLTERKQEILSGLDEPILPALKKPIKMQDSIHLSSSHSLLCNNF